jgi:RNA polymerase sigma factor (sigma-70 family)
LFKSSTLLKLPDEDLLIAHKESGEESYLRVLYARYLSLIYGVCLKYLKDADKAEDAVMQLFENLRIRISNYEIDNFKSWIYSVTKNYCLQILRNENDFVSVDFDSLAKEYNNGNEANELHPKMVRNYFSEDAEDGYNQLKEDQSDRLKELENQITQQTDEKSGFNMQRWLIALAVLLIIVLSVFFFLSDKIFPAKDTVYFRNRVDSLFISKYTIDSLGAIQLSSRAPIATPVLKDSISEIKIETPSQPTDLVDLSQEKSKPPMQVVEKKKSEESRNTIQNQVSEERNNNYSLSNEEIEALFSAPSKERPKITDDLNQTPKPAIGDKAYNEYINKNHHQLTGDDCANQHGNVILMFKVNRQGRPVDITVLRSLCREADKEAIRLLQEGPNWTLNNNYTHLTIAF